MTQLTTIDAFELPGLGGAPIRLADHVGRPMLIANTASLCGFTPQYAGLQALSERYAARGLLVLAVPSDDFGGQEPGDAGSIGATCRRLGVTFPVAAKAAVSGPGAIPLFQWLGAQAGWRGRPRWNFYKYVIGRDGRLVRWFSSLTRPDSSRVRLTIERCLETT